MSRFVLTAQLQLQAPRNTRQVVNQMQQQLQNVNVQINPVINNQALSNANAQLTKVSASAQSVSKNLRGASRSAESFGSALGAAARRFASITLATGFFLGITRAMGSAVGRAVEFEKEMLKISQVTGKSVRGLQALSNEVTNLATTFGVSSEEILGAARTLSQAGLAADQVTKSLRILAQTDLAATFDNIADTTEGAVALINQFRKEVRAAGSEAKFLENALDAINAVSKNFAVESADLISVVRRTGGVFEAAGGKLNELIALFTSVRSTTRETADTIATGFRTIFTRIQRTETIDSLKELGIVLQDTTGKFVGPLEAIKRLSAGLSGLDPRDFRFNEIVEQLGGFRQIGKVIPLIKQYSTSVEALAVANNSMGSTATDAATAQQGLGNQFSQLKEKFDATIRSIADGDTFRSLAEGAIRLAESVLKIVDALEPLMPMLTALAAFKLGQIAVPAFGRFAGIGGKNQGGRIHGFNRGGYVPGTGNRDTVPAMLTPGEFVIRKSSVNKIGASRLAEMNGYANGTTGRGAPRGGVKLNPTLAGAMTADDIAMANAIRGEQGEQANAMAALKAKPLEYYAQPQIAGFATLGGSKGGGRKTYNLGRGGTGYDFNNGFFISGSQLTSADRGIIAKNRGLEPDDVATISSFPARLRGSFSTYTPSHAALTTDGAFQNVLAEGAKAGLEQAFDVGASMLRGSLDLPPVLDVNEDMVANARGASVNDDAALKSIEGYLQEGMISALSGAIPAAGQVGFDLPAASLSGPIKERLGAIYGSEAEATLKAELKRSLGQVSDKQKGLPKKTANDIMAGDLGGIIERFAAGGSAKGSDTIPAMLTPGEYVINKKSAQQIGYGNLNRMNKSGVAKFNTGGPVQHFAFGGGPTSPNPLGAAMSGGGGDPMAGVGQAAKNLVASINTLNNSITAAVDDFAVLQTLDDKIITAIQPFATAINQTAQQIPTVITTMKQSFATASEAVVQSTAAFAQGFSTIDDLIREQLSASTQRIVQGAADFATGLATIDDTLRTSLSSALTAPMTAAAKQLETEMKAFGTELKTKAKIFDTLKDDVETLAKALKTYTTMTTEASDDLGTLKDDITFMAEALMIAGERIIEAGDDLSVLKDDISYLGMAINQTAGQLVENSDDLDILKAPATQMAAGLNKGMSAITHFTGFMGKLNAAIIQMTQNIQAGIAPINMTSVAFADTPQKLTELEMKIEQLEQQLAQVIAAAQKAGINLQNVGVTPVTGGAAAGGAAAGGGMMAGMGNNLMMAGMAAGMLAQSLDGLSDSSKQFIMDLSMIGGMLGMLAMSMHGLVAAGLARLTGEVLNTTAGVVNTGAKVANTGAINQNTAAQMLNTRAGAAAGGILTGLTIALTYTIMRSKALGEQAKELGKEFESSMKDLKESGVGVSLEQAQAKIGAALQKEAEARESMVGGIIGTIAGVVAAVAFVAAGIASGGTLFLATAAIVATAGIAGAEMGASFATASEATAGAADLLVASTYHASQGLGQLAVATKQMELEQLEGMDLLRRQSATFEKFHTSSLKATAAFNAFQNLDAGLSGEMREDMDASDVFEDVREQGVDAMKEMAQALFQEAQNLRKGISGAVEEMAKTGASVDEIFANKDIQKGFQDLGSAINQALTIQMLMTGQMKNEAKARMGLVGVMESEMSIAQRKQLIELESQLIQQEANKTSKDAVEAEKKRHRERLEAEAKERAAAEQKLRSDIALARASFAAAQAVDLFAAEMLNFGGTLDMVMLEFGALTGSVKQYKTQNDKLIGSLATGTITPEAEAAAMQTADQFGVQAETAKLLNNIKETERIRKVLTEKGLEEFDNNLNETASNLKIEKFLTDNNIDLSGLDADVRAEILKFFEDGLQPGEIEEIIDMVNSENESQIKVLQELAKAHNQYLGALFKFGDAVIKVENEMIKSFSRIVDVQLKGAERIAQAQGRDLTRAEVAGAAEAKRNAPLQAAGLVGGGVQATEIQLQRKRQRQQQIAAEIKIRADKGQTEEVIKLQNEQKKLNNQTKLLKDNLKALADQADLAAAVMGEIEKERGRRETIQGLIKEFTFASNEGRQEMDRNFIALQRVLATGNLNAIPDEMRGAVGGLLDRLKDIELRPGMTGADISKNLQAQMANALAIRARGFGLNPQELKKIFESTTKEDKLVNDLRAINQEEQAAAQALHQAEANQMQDLIASIQGLIATLQNAQAAAGNQAGNAMNPPRPPAGGAGGAGGGGAGGFAPFALGGVVYASEGQSIFKPKGTDTVPAMLTPGEFVVNRKAAQNNMGALTALNSGKTKYLAKGGPVTSFLNAGGIEQAEVYTEAIGSLGKKLASNEQAFRDAGKNIDVSKIDFNAGEVGGVGGIAFLKFDSGMEFSGGWDDYIPKWTKSPFTIVDGQFTRIGFERQPLIDMIDQITGITRDTSEISKHGQQGSGDSWNTSAVPSWNAMIRGGHPVANVKDHLQLSSLINAYRFFYNKGYTGYKGNVGYGNDKNTHMYDYATGPPGFTRAATWLLSNQSEGESGAFTSRWFSQTLRDAIINKPPSSKTNIPNQDSFFANGPSLRKHLKNLRKSLSSFRTSHPDFMVRNGKPLYTAQKSGDRVLPDFSNLGRIWDSPTQTTFDYFDNGPLILKELESIFFPSLLEGAEDLKDFDIEKNLVKNLTGSLLKKSFGNYGKFVQDSIFKNKLFTDNLPKFYRDPEKFVDENKAIMNQMQAALEASRWNAWPGEQEKAFIQSLPNTLKDPAQLFDNKWKVGWNEKELLELYGNQLGYIPWNIEGSQIIPTKLIDDILGENGLLSDGLGRAFVKANNTINNITGSLDQAKALGTAQGFTTLLEALEGPKAPDGIGNALLGDIQNKIKNEKEDEKAEAAAQEAGLQAALRRNFNVFYGTPEAKAQALLTNLGEAPGVDGAPFIRWAVPKGNPLKGQDGVFDPRIKRHRKVMWVSDVKRNAESFDALFPYLRDLGNTVLAMGAAGHVLAAGNDGSLSFNQLSLQGKLPVKDAEGKVTEEGMLTMNDKAKSQMAEWSNTPYPKWEEIGGRDYEMLLGLFWNFKKLDIGLKTMQNSTRNAIVQADRANESRPWSNWFQNNGGIPKWLEVALPQVDAGGNVVPLNVNPQGFAVGGPVGVSFKPKGTDTVPAMLTPGEFVMRKSAVDKYGVGFMSAINGGGVDNTGPYFSTGGRAVSQFGAPIDRRLDTVLNTVKSNSTNIKDVKDAVSKITNNTANIAAKTTNNDLLADQETAKAILRQAQSNRSGIQENNDDIADINSAMLTSSEYESLFEQVKKLKKRLKKAIPEMKDLSRDLGAAQGALNQILWLVQNQDLARAFNFSELANQIAGNVFNPAAFLAKGGSVPGVGNQDTVSAMLTPGEFVMKKSAVGKYGKSFMSAINSGAIPQMFALGGAVIPPKFWQTNTVGKAEDPNRVNAITRMLGFGNKSLFGGEMAEKYMQNVNDQGRGVWRQYAKATTSDWFPTDFTNVSDSNYGSLYVRNKIGNDGDVMAFMLKRMADIRDINFGLYSANVPQFGVDGPYRFGEPAWDNPAFTGNTAVGRVTTGQFASMWIPFAKRLFLPGYDGSLGQGQRPKVFSYSQNLRTQATDFLKKALLDGTWNPVANPNAFNMQRIIAGLGRTIPDSFIQLIEKAAQQQGVQLGKIDANTFPATSFFAKGGMARGTDTVPAMLTPGEFVMKKSAVQKYGLGFMRAINDSGPSTRVGRGVQYKHEGDVMGAGGGIDFSGLSNSIGELGSQVSTSLSAFESAFLGFSKLSSLLSDTINSIANLNITHTVNISGSLSIPGFSQQAINDIVKVISDQIADSTDGKVKRALSRFKRDQDNRT